MLTLVLLLKDSYGRVKKVTIISCKYRKERQKGKYKIEKCIKEDKIPVILPLPLDGESSYILRIRWA